MPKITSYHRGSQAGLWTKIRLFWFRKKSGAKHKKTLKRILVFLVGAFAVFLIGVVGIFAYFVKDLPNA
ncbi:MAG: hypothetical protein Q8N59_02840, partial [bacterium]|nr:hypothetical protein [bacterium]